MIKYKIVSISEAPHEIVNILEKKYSLKDDLDKREERLKRFLGTLKDNIYVLIEHKYVDKLYRDSFYSYFSSKRNLYERDTIRLTFFSAQVELDGVDNFEKIQKSFQDKFLGFLVIRPIRRMIGRNVISPKAFKNRNVFVRVAKYHISLNGMKLEIEGFPHSSQDAEAMTCAEIAIWSLMEYFGAKYSDYATTFPSKIRASLESRAYQRQLPSNGLPMNDISYVLKELGFSPKIYSREAFYKINTDSYDRYYDLLNYYVESGIPVILILTDKNIGHAVLCIGRKYISIDSINKIKPESLNGAFFYDFHNAERELIVMDDNIIPYQFTSAEKPTQYYDEEYLRNCKITSFIVPLHSKIYLDADKVRSYIKQLLTTNTELIFIDPNKNHYLRIFLTTSNSLKQNVAKNATFDADLKSVVLSQSLPKFTWVCEISYSEEDINNKVASGLLLIDATETDQKGLKPLILAAINNELIYYKESSGFFIKISLPLRPFTMFNDNLKQFK